MQHGRRHAKTALKPLGKLRGQADFRRQKQTLLACGQHPLHQVQIYLRLAAGRYAIEQMTGITLGHTHGLNRGGLLLAQREWFLAKNVCGSWEAGLEPLGQPLFLKLPNNPPPAGRTRGKHFFRQAAAPGFQQRFEKVALPGRPLQTPGRVRRNRPGGSPAQRRGWQRAAVSQLLRQRIGKHLS